MDLVRNIVLKGVAITIDIESNCSGRLITYPGNGRAVLLKSRMMENHKSGSVRGLIVAFGRRWL